MLSNPTPQILKNSAFQAKTFDLEDEGTWKEESFTADEIYGLIRSINDPEHPVTLEQLSVVRPEHIRLDPMFGPEHPEQQRVLVEFTPTIPHCSMATLIGLCIRVKLWQMLPRTFVTEVRIRQGTHAQENSINKQLLDKERVAAALENDQLAAVVQECLYGAPRMGIAL